MNEEGLPIIEISEPVESSSPSQDPPYFPVADDPTPLTSLSDIQKESWRRQRDEILDALEKEEEREMGKEAEKECHELDKRRETAKAEAELRAAREMQKKMGKALLRNIAEAREREERQRQEDNSAIHLRAGSSKSGEKSLKPRKSVTFAEPPKDGEEDKPNLQRMEKKMKWGDVSAGPMNGSSRQYLRNKSDLGKQPMRLEVVERVPGQKRSEHITEEHLPDSDDESIPDDAPSRSHIPPWLRDDEGPFSPQRFSDDDDDDSDQDEEQNVDSQDDFDFDTARHQREVFLEYNRLRGTIGADIVKAMSSHTHEAGEDEWDQPVRESLLPYVTVLTPSYRRYLWKQHLLPNLRNTLCHASKHLVYMGSLRLWEEVPFYLQARLLP